MKKIFLIISLSLILVSSRFVFAAEENNHTATTEINPHTATTETNIHSATHSSETRIFPTHGVLNDTTRISDLKTRADLEVTRRTDALNKLIAKINGFKKISTTQKSELTTQIQAQIDGLNTLKIKIDADTDLVTLRADVKSIITDYRIYVFFIQDINLISAAERMGTVLDYMTILSGKLETRIQNAQNKGNNVTELNTSYTDMQTKLTGAKTLLDQVNSELTGLSASGYPGNKTNLDDARAKLKEVYTDVKAAYLDGKQIIRLLEELKLFPTLTPTLTPVLTPTPTI